jgi:hypothetical protein
MSTNRLVYDTSNKQIQNQRNCVNFDGKKKLNVNYKTMTHDDKCFVDIQTRQSMGPGSYQVSNHYDCECEAPTTVNNATDNVMMFFKNGYDVSSCVVDDSTKLRIGASRKFPKCPNQLFTRPYKTVPYMGRGPGNMVMESQITPGEDTSARRSCNTLSGISIPHYFTPLVPHLDYNVQNPEHIIEEVVDEGWIRGGANSRLIVRDVDYLHRCGYAYMDKSTNEEFWTDKHRYL